MRRLTKQLVCLDPKDPPLPSTGMDKPLTVELYHRTQQTSVLIPGLKKQWRCQNPEEQAQTLYNLIISETLPTHLTATPTLTSNDGALTNMSIPPSNTASSSQVPVISDGEVALLTSLVKNQDWNSVREKLKGVEDLTLLHIIDCGGQPECHEMLPLLFDGQALTLIFLSLVHDLDSTFEVVFRQKEGSDTIQYQSVLTTREVIQRILCSISSLQPSLQKPAALLVGTYLDQTNDEAVLALDRSVKEQFQSFIKKDILRPARVMDGEEQYITPINNMSEDHSDVDELRRVISDVIKKHFKAKEIPTATLLLHLLLHTKFGSEKGWCTLEECIAVARECGISKDDLLGEGGILQFVHKNYGTILHYIAVDGLKERVIFDPNVILVPLTQLFVISFACNPDEAKTAESIRATGEIPEDVMVRVCTSSSSFPIPPLEIVELLKKRYLIYENVCTAYSKKSYFMPCLLQPDPSVVTEDRQLLSSIKPAPLLLVPQSTQYVPLGLFPALIVKMSHTWYLDEHERYRNRIQFRVGLPDTPTVMVQFRQYSDCLQLRFIKGDTIPNDSSALLTCRQQLWEALESISAEYSHTRDVQWKYGFYCHSSLQHCRQPHVAICLHDKSVDMTCFHTPRCGIFPLEDKHICWFKVRQYTF